MRKAVRRWVRGLGVLLVVMVTSLGIVSQPIAATAAGGGTIFVDPMDLLPGATKTAPMRMVACATSILCLGANTAGTVALWWLMDTESGAAFREDAWNWINSHTKKKTDTNIVNCEVELGISWHGGLVTLDIVGETSLRDVGYPYEPGCEYGRARDTYVSFGQRGNVKCRRSDGTITVGAVHFEQGRWSEFPKTILTPVCSGDQQFIGIELGIDGTSSYGYASRNLAGWHPNPLVAQWELDGNGRIKTETTCLTADGETVVVEAMSVPGAAAPVAAPCPAGTAPIASEHAIEAPWGDSFYPVAGVGLKPGFVEQYPDCLGPGAPGCTMDVRLDGQICAFGVGECHDWWRIANAQPDRVRCLWGPYSLEGIDCEPLRYAYVTPGGAIVDPTLPPGSMPQPRVPEQPGDPVNPVPAVCPPTGSPIENGLNPTALNVMRCAMVEYPWIIPTSGYRPGSEYDHGTGDAVDLAPPAWDTPLGRDRGWWLAHWLVANAGALDITYVIFADMRWPAYDGSLKWVPYQHPSGQMDPSSRHLDHVHVSARGRTAPQPQPGDPVHPAPSPPIEGEVPGFPIGGDNPDPGDGTNCLADGWTWNPVSWVYTPIKCGLTWAFVPPADSDPFGGATSALDGTPLGQWVAAPSRVLGALSGSAGGNGQAGFNAVLADDGSLTSMQTAANGGGMGTQAIGDCSGPAFTFQAFGSSHTMNPLSACSGATQVLATIVRTSLMLGLYIGGFVVVVNQLAAAMGLQVRLGGGDKEAAA